MYKIIIIFLLFTQNLWASIIFWPIGLSSRLERDEDQSLVSRNVQQMAGGVRILNWSAELSRSTFSTSTQEGNITIQRNYEDFTLWLGHHFVITERLDFVGWGGLGIFIEKIRTVVGSASSTSTAEQKSLLGINGELRWKPFEWGLLLSTGARVLGSENFDPNPQPELYVRAGWQF